MTDAYKQIVHAHEDEHTHPNSLLNTFDPITGNNDNCEALAFLRSELLMTRKDTLKVNYVCTYSFVRCR